MKNAFKSKPLVNLAKLKSATAELEAAMLKNKTPSAETISSLAHLSSMSDQLRPRAAQECGRVAGHVMTNAIRGARIRWDQLDRIEPQVAAEKGSPDLSHDLIAYLRACGRIVGVLNKQDLTRLDAQGLRPHAPNLLTVIDQVGRDYPQARSLDILRGGVVSLSDRDGARQLYAEATRLGEDGMATSIFDLGAHTYLNAAEVAARRKPSMIEDASTHVASAIAKRPDAWSRPEVNLLWSVDVGFLEIYGPYWFNLAPYLMRQGMGLVFAVVGEPDRVAAVIETSRELIAQLARFHRLPDADGYARAFSFVPVTLPDQVGQAKTFYACARMLVAERLLEVTQSPVLMLDADFTAHDPVDAFVKRLQGTELGVSWVRGLGTLWPWRRTIANQLWLTPSEGSRALLRHTADYITAGIGGTPSWTLDQNALTYGVEQIGDTPIFQLQDLPRPFQQDKIRGQFEAAWRECNAA